MSKITCMRNQPAHNFGFLSDLSNRLLTPLPWISCIPHSSIIYVSLVTWCSVNIMEINNRMKQFYTEIYREFTQRFPQSTYSTLIHSLTQHKFIKSLPSLFICVDYAHNTPPKKKKNRILHYHLTLHCEVRSSSEMVSVAPSRRAEAINRSLRSILTWIRSLSKMWSSVWSSSECRLDLPQMV